MTAKLACAVMALTGACLGDRRRDWALAMRGELDVAVAEGRPLTFAVGCLTSALRDMPNQAEGRFTLTSHAVALGLLPIVALLIVGTGAGFPFLPTGHAGISGWLAGSGEHSPLLTPWNRGFAPSLAVLIWGLIAGHLLMPWFILERNWTRVGTLARINSAATVTLVLFTTVLFLDMAFLLLPVAVLAIELAASWCLYRWQEDLFVEAPPGTLVA
ncbi:hypothetical protein [Sphingomonas asaccharolytica]|uniref:hypothetical protein n=1 Tax=Sphingomonas asaccharolytica TaxID=40681 RepID=UPI000A66E1F3|nr:hypothetical protein [Sphingomonas asaccharolytica]